MKKITSLLLAVSLFFSCLASVEAEAQVIENREVDIVAFIELSIKRLIEAEEATKLSIATISDNSYTNYPNIQGEMVYETSLGSVHVNPSAMTVQSYDTILMNLNDDDDKNLESIYRAIIAMSVLEYGALNESILKIDRKQSAFRRMESLFFSQISDLMDSTIFWMNLKAGDPQEIYKGNFTYTLHYFQTTSPTDNSQQELIMLEAKQ